MRLKCAAFQRLPSFIIKYARNTDRPHFILIFKELVTLMLPNVYFVALSLLYYIIVLYLCQVFFALCFNYAPASDVPMDFCEFAEGYEPKTHMLARAEQYFCKDDIFRKTYESTDDESEKAFLKVEDGH